MADAAEDIVTSAKGPGVAKAKGRPVTELDEPDDAAPEPVDFPPKEIHWHALKQIGRSPLHYKASVLAGVDPSAAMRLGSLIHFLLAGPNEHPIVLYPGGDRRGNAWKEFKALHPKKTIITEKELASARLAADAVFADRVASPILAKAKRLEAEMRWGWLGRACAGTLDVIGDDGTVWDIKSTADADPRWWYHQARRLGYLGQLAWYLNGAQKNGWNVTRAGVIAVENKAPYAVVVHRLSERALEAGAREARLHMEKLLVCEQSGDYPGYAQSELELDVPEEGAELDWSESGEIEVAAVAS